MFSVMTKYLDIEKGYAILSIGSCVSLWPTSEWGWYMYIKTRKLSEQIDCQWRILENNPVWLMKSVLLWMQTVRERSIIFNRRCGWMTKRSANRRFVRFWNCATILQRGLSLQEPWCRRGRTNMASDIWGFMIFFWMKILWICDIFGFHFALLLLVGWKTDWEVFGKLRVWTCGFWKALKERKTAYFCRFWGVFRQNSANSCLFSEL